MTAINRRELLQLTAALPLVVPGTVSNAAESDQATHAKTPESAGTFDELPVGAVRPEGWLLTQLQKQADGVTSHLQRLYAPFTSNAWLADEPDPKGSWWPWEVRGYWCDGTLRCGLLLGNQTLIEEASSLVRYTFSHPQADGYLGPSSLRAAGDANRWPHAVFFRAAMAWHDATRDASIVEALRRHYLESKFNYIADRATTNVEAMLWTYERTGDERLLRLAQDSWARSQKFLAMNDGSFGLTEQSWLSPGPCREVHGVTYAELTKIPTLLYRATHEEHYLQVAVAAQRKIFEHHLLLGGVPSTSEVLSTTTARDAHEVCNAIDYPWTWGYLLGATGDGMYGDRIERATFNGLPGSIKKDFKALQYYSSPNQFICTGHSDHVSSMKGTPLSTITEWRYLQRMSYRPSPGYSVVCCPGNLSRALPNYISRMWMADRSGKGLAATLYGPSRVKHRVGAQQTEAEIHADTAYPYADSIVFRIKTPRDVEFPLHLRIPAWCKTPKLSVNDRETALPQIREGFMTVRRTWRSGDTLRLQLPMTITTSQWPEDGVAIERGPLVYAYPIAQQWTQVEDERSSPEFPAWDLAPVGAWNFTLLRPSEDNKLTFSEHPPSSDPWSTAPSSITVAARQVRDWSLLQTQVNDVTTAMTPRLPDSASLASSAVGPTRTLGLVPYANTELRLAVFPRLKIDPVEG
jgi:hypothetical protein